MFFCYFSTAFHALAALSLKSGCISRHNENILTVSACEVSNKELLGSARNFSGGNTLKKRVSLELRALICEREHPQDDNLNCRGQRGEEIVRILREGFFFFFLFLFLRVEPVFLQVLRVNEEQLKKHNRSCNVF